MMPIAFAADTPSADATFTRPSSSTSIFTPVRSMMLRIILPPGPMTSRILSTGIRMVTMRGAKSEMFWREAPSASFILPRMCRRPLRAWSSAVADFTPARAGHASRLADREGREVVVEHEALPRLALEALDLLRIVGGAERAGDERLRFAASEHGRAVDARQDAGLDPDVANL